MNPIYFTYLHVCPCMPGTREGQEVIRFPGTGGIESFSVGVKIKAESSGRATSLLTIYLSLHPEKFKIFKTKMETTYQNT